MIEVDIDSTVYQIVKDYPKVKEIMMELGFNDIVKPKMLMTVGRLMTIPKGCRMKNVDLEEVKTLFRINGIELKEY